MSGRIPPRALPAMITPFTASGELDLESHATNVALLGKQGFTGFLVAGSTGEGPYLEPGERRDLVSATRAVAPDAFVLCGVAAESTRQANAQVDEAAAGGADAALVVTPTTLIRGDHDSVVRFYRQVANAAPIPIFIYTVPRVTGYELPPDRIVELAAEPNIQGVKDSSGRAVRMREMRDALDAAPVQGPFRMYTGSSNAVVACLGVGAHGAILAAANYLGDLVLRLLDVADDDYAEAEALQARLTEVSTTVTAAGPAATKAAAGIRGLAAGAPRAPLAPVGPATLHEVREALATVDPSVAPAADAAGDPWSSP